MLKVKLGKAFAFLPQANINPSQALQDFFGDIDPTKSDISEEMMQGLSNEWLLFDYKPMSGKTLIKQYYFHNPDNLSDIELNELKQIIQTQSLHLLQTYSKSEPPYIFLQSIFTGKKFKVYDRKLSLSIDQLEGSFLGRLAKVGKTNYSVGSNPLAFPIRYTQRAIKIFTKEKTAAPTLKDIVRQLSEPRKRFNKAVNIGSEQKKLEKRYTKLAREFQSQVSFKEIIDLVYKENYQHHFADYITGLIKLGIPEEMCLEYISLFHEIWNYFPHKILKNKCPHELYEETYGT